MTDEHPRTLTDAEAIANLSLATGMKQWFRSDPILLFSVMNVAAGRRSVRASQSRRSA